MPQDQLHQKLFEFALAGTSDSFEPGVHVQKSTFLTQGPLGRIRKKAMQKTADVQLNLFTASWKQPF